MHLGQLYSFDNNMRKLYTVGAGFSCESVENPFSSFFHGVIWARITMPIQAVILMIETIARQGIFSVMIIATGIIAFDFHRFKVGCIGLISCIVQLITFPIIAVVSIFSPYYSCELARLIHGYEAERRYELGSKTVYDRSTIGKMPSSHFPNHFFPYLDISGYYNGTTCQQVRLIFYFITTLPFPIINSMSLLVCEIARMSVAWRLPSLSGREDDFFGEGAGDQAYSIAFGAEY